MMEPYYQDGLVTLYHGDALELVGEWITADVMVTDPPYGISWRRGLNLARGSRSHAGIENDESTMYRDAALDWFCGTSPMRPAVVFGSLYAPFPRRLRQVLIWRKPPDSGVVGSTTGWRRDVDAVFLCGRWPRKPAERSSVIESVLTNSGNPSSPAGRTGHPHAKPVDLLGVLIATCPPGRVVDPFAGAGSTLLAARLHGRSAIGVEIDESYCEVTAKRLEQGALDFEVGA